jgi:CRISPR-associated endonuclease Cas2
MPKLICYDITNDNLRTKLGKKIIAAGLDRINKSVYLGQLSTTAFVELEQSLAQLVNTKGEPQDSLIIISVAPQQVQDMKIIGNNELDKEELSGDKSTLIL